MRRNTALVRAVALLFVLIGILAFTRGAAAQVIGRFVPAGDMTIARAECQSICSFARLLKTNKAAPSA